MNAVVHVYRWSERQLMLETEIEKRNCKWFFGVVVWLLLECICVWVELWVCQLSRSLCDCVTCFPFFQALKTETLCTIIRLWCKSIIGWQRAHREWKQGKRLKTKLTTKTINMLERCRWLCVLWFTLQISMFTQKKTTTKNKESLWVCWVRCNTAQQWHCCFCILFVVLSSCLPLVWTNIFPSFIVLWCVALFSGCKCEFNHHSISASARVNSAFVVFGFVFVDVCVSTPFYAMAFNMKFV